MDLRFEAEMRETKMLIWGKENIQLSQGESK